MSEKNENQSNKTSDKKNKTKKVDLTKEEITDFLKNSILIPKEQWETLPENAYISYYKDDDTFIKGGYVKLIFNKNNNNYLIYGTKVNKYNNDKYYKEFTINLSNIKEIYKKIDQSAIIEYQIIKNNISKFINETNSKLENIILKLNSTEKKIVKLEENHYKTLKLIKNLHKIKSLDNIN